MFHQSYEDSTNIQDARRVIIRLLRESISRHEPSVEALTLADRYLELNPEDREFRKVRDRCLCEYPWIYHPDQTLQRRE